MLEQVPEDFTYVAIPNNKIAPNLAKRGIYAVRYARADASLSYFGMENPVVGGYTPEKVALRRAIALAVNVDEEIRLVRRGQAIVAESLMGPGVWGYDPAFKSEMGDFSRARAQALLDLYGYVDRDGDGWRDQPDGSALVIEYATQPDDLSRQLITEWKKNMDAIGVRIVFRTAQWPENLKASRSGKLMMWGVGWSAGPDGAGFLLLGYGPSKGQANHARFELAEYDRLLRSAAPPARRARAHGRHDRDEEAARRLHAVQGPRPPHLDRPRPALGGRLPPQRLPARVLEICRHRHRRAGAPPPALSR